MRTPHSWVFPQSFMRHCKFPKPTSIGATSPILQTGIQKPGERKKIAQGSWIVNGRVGTCILALGLLELWQQSAWFIRHARKALRRSRRNWALEQEGFNGDCERKAPSMLGTDPMRGQQHLTFMTPSPGIGKITPHISHPCSRSVAAAGGRHNITPMSQCVRRALADLSYNISTDYMTAW